jgi:hypothetical protein
MESKFGLLRYTEV